MLEKRETLLNCILFISPPHTQVYITQFQPMELTVSSSLEEKKGK